VVDPGERGVRVTLGNMESRFIPPGWGFKLPLITGIRRVNVQQDTREMAAECFSSDVQQINIHLEVPYRIPETSVVTMLRDYTGTSFEKLILPRIQEATKEVTPLETAALQSARAKIGELLVIEDLVIEDVALSKELENAIEAKTDAESIRIQGEALQGTPKLVELKMVEKWSDVAPPVVGSGSNILLPLGKGP
jgi:prohibitin 2